MAKSMTFKPVHLNDGTRVPQHFFAASMAEWRVHEDPVVLINAFKREGYSFTLWYVPVDIRTNYEIEYFSPIVEGAKMLGTYIIKLG